MKRARLMFLFVTIAATLPLTAQTVYYNHPKGVSFAFSETTVAKLTLPAGTYHVIFKADFSPAPQTGDTEPKPILCRLLVTGIANVPSPFAADNMEVPISTPSGEALSSVQGIMETAFTTKGGTVRAACIVIDRNPFTVVTSDINLSASKISTLIRQ